MELILINWFAVDVFEEKKKTRLDVLERGSDQNSQDVSGEIDFDQPLVDAVIVMEEFMKELASILDARGSLASLRKELLLSST